MLLSVSLVSLHMSGRNGSASDADCQISEDSPVPDVELMELGPLLEEGGARPPAYKGSHPEVGLLFLSVSKTTLVCLCNSICSFIAFQREHQCCLMRTRMMTRWGRS